MQVHEQIDTRSDAAKAQADKHSKSLAPMYAGQPVATYDTLRKIWVPATVICLLPQSSYLVRTSNGSTYRRTRRHLREHSVKADNTVPSGTPATLQARPHFLVEQPASPAPAPCMQPTSVALATLATQMKQAPAVPATPAVPEECPGIEVCDIPCHTRAATKIWPCPHGTKMPDPRDLGTVDPDCPQTLYNALPNTSPTNRVVNRCVIYSQKGGCRMIALYRLKSAPTNRPVDKSSFSQ